MWTLHPNQYANWSKSKHERLDGNTVKVKNMKNLEPKFHSKIICLPTVESEDCFALLHVGTNEGDSQYASFLGMAITKIDEDGLYYIVVENTPFDERTQEFPTVLMAFHNSVVENSDIPWEIFKAKMDGEFDNK